MEITANTHMGSMRIPNRLRLKTQITLGWIVLLTGIVLTFYKVWQDVLEKSWYEMSHYNSDEPWQAFPLRWYHLVFLILCGAILTYTGNRQYHKYYLYVKNGTIVKRDAYVLGYVVFIRGLTLAGVERSYMHHVNAGYWHDCKVGDEFG